MAPPLNRPPRKFVAKLQARDKGGEPNARMRRSKLVSVRSNILRRRIARNREARRAKLLRRYRIFCCFFFRFFDEHNFFVSVSLFHFIFWHCLCSMYIVTMLKFATKTFNIIRFCLLQILYYYMFMYSY